MKKIASLSIIIPVYNDEKVLPELYKRLSPIASSLTDNYEIILVDDGSKDCSWLAILSLQKQDSNIIGIKLARNFGQQNAITAGLDQARNEIIVLMDSDLQDRPEDIPVLIEALTTHQTSMAIAQWISREDGFVKKMMSDLFFNVSNKITDIHVQPQLGIFRAMKREIMEELKKFPEKTATTISLLYYIGNNYVCVPLKRDARVTGKSGYDLRKMLSIAFSRIFSFSMFPIRVLTCIGFLAGITGLIMGIILIIRYFAGIIVPGWTSIMVSMLFLFGLNFAFLGILGEYIGKIFLETKQRPKYVVELISSKK